MARTFYYGSGSPYAWKVWLTLEHKQLDYDFKLLSFDRGDTRAPEFLAINPRGKVPTLVDDGLALWESSAVVEYLEERYPERPLMPQSPAARWQVRRLSAEADSYFADASRKLRPFVFGGEPGAPEAIAAAKQHMADELARFAGYLGGQEFLAGALSLADFALNGHLRLLARYDQRAPQLEIGALIPASLRAWLDRVGALPYHDKTIPPHWRA